jgi:3-hydroxyisobutyrate dehydrogenase
VDQGEAIRGRLAALGAAMIAAPVSGNAKCVRAGKLSAVCSGPEAAFREARPLIEAFAPGGVAYVGEGELARFCKIAHNVLLGVVIQNLAEITILAEKAGVPRHAFLAFINDSVMGSIFTRYKSNALVNLEWTTTFTAELLRKDLDLGLQAARALQVPMPLAAATREALQAHFGAAQQKPDPAAYLRQDFAALLETVALAAGITLAPENVPVPTGLEVLED